MDQILSAVGSTHIGYVHNRNEDCFGLGGREALQSTELSDHASVSDLPFLAVVADGLGGHPCGDLASRLVVGTLLSSCASDGKELVSAVHAAHDQLIEESTRGTDCVGVASTIVAALIIGDRCIVVNVGDSRGYIADADGRLTLLSTDDVPSGAHGLPGVPTTGLTQSLGGTTREPVVHLVEIDWTSGDRLLLCSDGLSSVVPQAEISSALRSVEIEDAAQSLVDAALAAGGPDNITVVVVGRVPRIEPADR